MSVHPSRGGQKVAAGGGRLRRNAKHKAADAGVRIERFSGGTSDMDWRRWSYVSRTPPLEDRRTAYEDTENRAQQSKLKCG